MERLKAPMFLVLLLLVLPMGSAHAVPAGKFATERVASSHDDWEPAIAADDSGHVYQLITRFGAKPACGHCPKVFIALRRSVDGGATWLPDEYLCKCRGRKSQYDPVIMVDDQGRVFANWLEGYTPGVVFARSDDFGETWTDPHPIATPSVSWSDKPWFALSADGEDVYEYLNGEPRGSPSAVVSYDAGDTWETPILMPYQKNFGRYYFASGAAVLADGTALNAQTAFRRNYHDGRVFVYVYRSTDEGKTFTRIKLDSAARGPICPKGSGCGAGYLGSQIAMASDAQGNAYVLYNSAFQPEGPARVFFSRSTDSGLTWSSPKQLSDAPVGSNHDFPMLVASGEGIVGAAWMDDRTGMWNTWYRQSQDGGLTWGAGQRLSNRPDGRRYKTEAGFEFPYGDYGMLAMGDGKVWATWGESPSYIGPGGVWLTHRSLP